VQRPADSLAPSMIGARYFASPPTTTDPTGTGIALITAARADGLTADIRLATAELVTLPLISAHLAYRDRGHVRAHQHGA
jgi:hypothetical protein